MIRVVLLHPVDYKGHEARYLGQPGQARVVRAMTDGFHQHALSSSNRGDDRQAQSTDQDEVFEFLPGVASLMEDLDSEKNLCLNFACPKFGFNV
jgi:hypothetical protein